MKKCIHCGKEIKDNNYEWFGLDGDYIHKSCRPKIDKEMDTISKMNNKEFYDFMGTSNIMKGVEK